MKAKTISIGAVSLYVNHNVVGTITRYAEGWKKIDEVKIIGNTKKSTEANIIQVQKKSVEVIERVGAAQLSKQGVGNVATAVTKATGTLKQGVADRFSYEVLATDTMQRP